MTDENNGNQNWFEKLRDKAVKLSGREKNPPYKLHDKPLDELLDLATAHMQKGKHFSDIPLALTTTEIDENRETHIKHAVAGEMPDEDHYDIHFLYSELHERLGETLATYPEPETLAQISKQFRDLMQIAVQCEKKVEERNKAVRNEFNKIDRILFTTRNHSRDNYGVLLILEGYQNPEVEQDIEKQIKDIYDLIAGRDTTRLQELDTKIDDFIRNIGRLIRRNQDDSLAWQLDLISTIAYGLNDQRLVYYSREQDVESPERRLLDDDGRKLWATFQLLQGYFKGKYKDKTSKFSRIPESAKAQQEAFIASRFDKALKQRLKDTSKISGGFTIIPSIIDKYLLTIGVERGKHYS